MLDEIGELPLTAQPKLLRAIECGEVLKVGGERPVRVQSRIVASTNQDLESLCRRRLFRPDLYYRLSVIEIRISPLRERIEDVEALTNHFLRNNMADTPGRTWENCWARSGGCARPSGRPIWKLICRLREFSRRGRSPVAT